MRAADAGATIRGLREAAGLSQADLAARMGVSRQTIANWERNSRELTIGHFRRIAEALKVDPMFFLGQDDGELRAYLDEARKRTVRVSMEATPDDTARIERARDELGLASTPEAAYRLLLRGLDAPEPLQEDEEALLRDFRAMGADHRRVLLETAAAFAALEGHGAVAPADEENPGPEGRGR